MDMKLIQIPAMSCDKLCLHVFTEAWLQFAACIDTVKDSVVIDFLVCVWR